MTNWLCIGDCILFMFSFSDSDFLLFWLQAAKETGALQDAKNKLEKQVEDLTLRLQLEKRIRVGDYDFAITVC